MYSQDPEEREHGTDTTTEASSAAAPADGPPEPTAPAKSGTDSSTRPEDAPPSAPPSPEGPPAPTAAPTGDDDPKRFGAHIERLPLQKELTLPLDEHAIAARAFQAADLSAAIDDLEEDKKATIRRLTKELDEENAKLRLMMKSIRESHETRLVECVMIKDFNEMAIRYEYQGRVVEDRPMTADERQPDLPLDNRSLAAGEGNRITSLADLDAKPLQKQPTAQELEDAGAQDAQVRESLSQLRELWEAGRITGDEYQQRRADILGIPVGAAAKLPPGAEAYVSEPQPKKEPEPPKDDRPTYEIMLDLEEQLRKGDITKDTYTERMAALTGAPVPPEAVEVEKEAAVIDESAV